MATSRIARATESPAGVEPAPPAPLDVDVLVLGSGIAGAVAAITAASEGARVALACIGRFLGGSSFFPGTWGLGLIGPRDALDAEDLIDSILDVGQGVAEPGLVRTLVEGIPPAIGWLERELDVALKRPESDASADETAFIPCFDRNRRLWRGLTRTELERAFACAVRERGVRILEHAELVDMVKDDDGAVSCAWLYDRRRDELRACRVGAAVLACGGTSGLFARRLTAGDVIGSGHGIALQQGCTLANIEFMQMMPGYVSPVPGLVFNEKTFRYIEGVGSSPRLHDISPTRQAALLEMRSGHGPFSARHDDRLIDLAIDEAGETGLAVHYDLPPYEAQPEFVRVFNAWLEDEHGIRPTDELRIALYAHASNGGIAIGSDAQTEVPGLFACGEATGGMHGADRIGGLSSANGLVFGRIAGTSAARWARRRKGDGMRPRIEANRPSARGIPIEKGRSGLKRIREIMGACAMVARDEAGLEQAAIALRRVDEERRAAERDTDAAAERAADLRLRAQTLLAQSMICAMRARTESRGAHMRTDRPGPDARFAHPSRTRLGADASPRTVIG
ncbi:MAG: FAD-binding protein [Collinsella sp.]|nr:FAD-binding protein [Collinsella sp.]